HRLRHEGGRGASPGGGVRRLRRQADRHADVSRSRCEVSRLVTSQATILVVEDNPFTRKIVRITLEKAGYRVQEAPDGRTALAHFRDRPPDLVIQDLMLPDMDGADLARQLRETPEGATIPILASSALLSQIDHAGTGMASFSDYLFKPAEPSRILE